MFPEVKRLGIRIRRMVRCDMPEVLDIENRSFEFPWSKGDFIRCARQRNCVILERSYSSKTAASARFRFCETSMKTRPRMPT